MVAYVIAWAEIGMDLRGVMLDDVLGLRMLFSLCYKRQVLSRPTKEQSERSTIHISSQTCFGMFLPMFRH